MNEFAETVIDELYTSLEKAYYQGGEDHARDLSMLLYERDENKEEIKKLKQDNKRYRKALGYLLDEVRKMDKPHEALTQFLKEALEGEK